MLIASMILPQNNVKMKKILTINSKYDTLLFQVQGISGNTVGELFISDKLDYCVKKFNKNGNYISSRGRRGRGPGEFNLGPANIVFDETSKNIAVVDHTTNLIYIFNNDLIYQSSILAAAAVSDIEYDNQGRLIVAMPPVGSIAECLQIYDENGKKDLPISVRGLIGNPLLDMFFVDFNKYHNKIIIMFRFKNKIQVYDQTGIFVREFGIPGLPDIAETKILPGQENLFKGGIPQKDMFWDVESNHKGEIFILSGDYSENPQKDIYIADIYGNVKYTITLAESSKFIYLDNENYLLASNGDLTSVVKYSLKYAAKK